MADIIIPGTDKVLLDGTILVLSGFDNVKYIIHNGFYTYNSELFEGWYGVSIPEQNVIPIAQQMLIGCEIFYYPDSNCSCRFPSGNIPFTTDDKYQLQRTFITVDTMIDRDKLTPNLSITDMVNGRLVRVNKPNNIDFNPRYYVYLYNEDLSGAYWQETAFGGNIPIATTEMLGGIIVGDNLTIDEFGRLSAQAGVNACVLNWLNKAQGDPDYDPTEVYENFLVLEEVSSQEISEYILYIKYANRYYPAVFLQGNHKYGASALVYNDSTNTIIRLFISCEDSTVSQFISTYEQDIDETVNGGALVSDYDVAGENPASQRLTALYIADYVSTNADEKGSAAAVQGNLDTLSNTVSGIEDLIPAQASSENQLADKNFVNSSVATNTAYFVGTFNSLQELTLYDGTVTNNDYAFVIIYNAVDPTQIDAYDRYKYNSQEYGYIALAAQSAPTWEVDTYYSYNHTTNEYVLTESEPADWSTNYNDYFIEKTTEGCWLFEYELNNSSFTAEQWAAINSGMTAALVTSINTHIANTTIHVTQAEKDTWNAKMSATVIGHKLILSSQQTTLEVIANAGY